MERQSYLYNNYLIKNRNINKIQLVQILLGQAEN